MFVMSAHELCTQVALHCSFV